jgi:hypothetical protein
MDTLKEQLNKSNNVIVKCFIRKPDGQEIWIKKEGDNIPDYEVLDLIIKGNYHFEEVYQVIV